MKELSEIFPFELVPSFFMPSALPFRGAHMYDYGAYCANQRTHKRYLRKHNLGKFRKGRNK